MRSLTVMSTVAVALLASVALPVSAAIKTTSQQAKKVPGPRNLRLGKTIEHMPSKSMFLTHMGNRKKNKNHQGGSGGHNQKAGGNIWPVSIFWTFVEVGTPPQKYAAAIDSGSSNLYILGKNCAGCVTGAPNHAYDSANSSTSSGPVGFGFYASYETCNPVHPTQSCTVSGKNYMDMASLGGFDPVQVKLGAIEYQTSNFYQFQTIEGVVGMIGGGEGTVFYQQCTVGGKCAPVWAICMVEGTKSNGTLTIGGVDESLASGPIQYVSSTNSSFFHEIAVHHMNVGGTKVPVGASAVLDTGTNDVLLSNGVYMATQTAICGNSSRKYCNSFFTSPQFCSAMTDAEVDAYPDITFALDSDVTLKITARDYLLKNSPAASSPDQYCFGLSNGGEGYAGFIIGDTLMQNYYLVFAEQKVGWAPVNRETCGSK